MVIIKKILSNNILKLLIVFSLLFILIYAAYFHKGKHVKDINHLRIIDIYELRVDIKVKQLIEQFCHLFI